MQQSDNVMMFLLSSYSACGSHSMQGTASTRESQAHSLQCKFD